MSFPLVRPHDERAIDLRIHRSLAHRAGFVYTTTCFYEAFIPEMTYLATSGPVSTKLERANTRNATV